MSLHYPKKNPKIEWEVPKGRDISNLILSSGGVDAKTKLRLIPAHLAPLAGKIKHLTKLLEAEIRAYDAALSKCEVAELRRIIQQEKDAHKEQVDKRIEEARKRVIKTYRGIDRRLAKKDGLTNTERKAREFQKFMEFAGDALSEAVKEKIKSFVEDTKLKFGDHISEEKED